MKIREIMETASSGASCAGAIATVTQPLGDIQRRVSLTPRTKYKNAAPQTVIKSRKEN